jgi:uncharacterized membrane protein
MRPTRPASLVLAALVSAVAAWLLINRFYGDLPRLNWLPGLTLGALAVAEGIAAFTTRARIERRPGAARVDPFLVARLVVLAKASAWVGAIFAGVYGGILVWALAEQGRLLIAEQNLFPAVAGCVGSTALVAAALLLERSCRVPDHPDDNPTEPPTTKPG